MKEPGNEFESAYPLKSVEVLVLIMLFINSPWINLCIREEKTNSFCQNHTKNVPPTKPL